LLFGDPFFCTRPCIRFLSILPRNTP